MPDHGFDRVGVPQSLGWRRLLRAAIAAGVLAPCLGLSATADTGRHPLSVRITSPLGRTGFEGAVRLVAQVQNGEDAQVGPVRFFVDGKPYGEATEGPPYAVEWTDENPFEPRDIGVEVCDAEGACVRDSVHLDPLEIVEESRVSSVLLEAAVQDAGGRYVRGLTAADFAVTEDGSPQELALVRSEDVSATYTLLVDASQSMSRRIDFVQTAATRLLRYLRPEDRVIVAPFTRSYGPITGPTDDRATVASAIASLRAGGGTAVLDALSNVPKLLEHATGRQAIVLITDGYDEHSTSTLESALRAIKAAQATVFVIGIGGSAGISIKGDRALRQIASQSGGRAFFPSRDEELPHVYDAIASDVQQRYLLGYTPTNQTIDGGWRAVAVHTTDPSQVVHVRPGYFAPKPPPVTATIEFTIENTDRRPVDVAADDLQIFEDGVPQTLEAFEEATAPLALVLAVDTSGSMRPVAEAVKDAARRFVEALRPSDPLALLTFSDSAAFTHDLTTNRQWTLAGLDAYRATGGTALNDALFAALDRLTPLQSRRAIVVLTDGRDENGPGTGPGSRHTADDVFARLRGVDAAIYTIGLGPHVDHDMLARLADASGGESFFPETASALSDEYHRVVEHLRRRYVARYTSSNATRDGRWRVVDIRTTNPSFTVKSRTGYFAPEH
jgi:Ca-activated chloride channel family protein